MCRFLRTGSLIITGNQASHGGGGIGANGGVVIGEATSLSYSISVKKAWDNPGYEDTQPSGVTIHLKERDTGDIVSTAELTGEMDGSIPSPIFRFRRITTR